MLASLSNGMVRRWFLAERRAMPHSCKEKQELLSKFKLDKSCKRMVFYQGTIEETNSKQLATFSLWIVSLSFCECFVGLSPLHPACHRIQRQVTVRTLEICIRLGHPLGIISGTCKGNLRGAPIGPSLILYLLRSGTPERAALHKPLVATEAGGLHCEVVFVGQFFGQRRNVF